MAGRVGRLYKFAGVGQRASSTSVDLQAIKGIVQADPAAAGKLVRAHLTPEELGKFQQACAEPG